MTGFNINGSLLSIDVKNIGEVIEKLEKLNETLKEAKSLIKDLAENEIIINLVAEKAFVKQEDL